MAWQEKELDERSLALQGLSWAMLNFFDKGGTLEDCEKIAMTRVDSRRRAEKHHRVWSELQGQ